MLAAANGHEGVVRLLLGHSPSPDVAAVDCGMFTALAHAAAGPPGGQGSEAVVRLLLGRHSHSPDIDVAAFDHFILTALAYARSEGIRQLLQGHSRGHTPGLNPGAKEFVFNPNAKAFSFGTSGGDYA